MNRLERHNRREEKRARGRHDRWSLEGAPRRFTFAFLCLGQASDDPTKMRRYTIGLTSHVYFGNSSNSTMTPEAHNLSVGRIMAKVHNPIKGQQLFVESIIIGRMELLVQRAPIEVFTSNEGFGMRSPTIVPGESIDVKVSCELIRGRR